MRRETALLLAPLAIPWLAAAFVVWLVTSRLRPGTPKQVVRVILGTLALEPTYAQAQAGIALVQAIRVLRSLAVPHTVMPGAKDAAFKTLALDETVADAHAVLAFVLHLYEWDWAGAKRAYRRALDLNPDDTVARRCYAILLVETGRADASVTEARSAPERDPLSAHGPYILAIGLALAGRYEEAIAEAHAGLELDSSYALLYQPLGWGLAGLGRYAEAVDAFTRQATLSPGELTPQAYLGWALGLAGQKQEAVAILNNLERRRSQTYVAGTLLAYVSLGLGDHDQATSWLQEAAEERDGLMANLTTEFAYDPLRSDPRFQAILQRMNFPAQA